MNIRSLVLAINIFVVIFASQEHPTLKLKHVEFYTLDTIQGNDDNTTFIIPKYFSELQYECVSMYPTKWLFGFNTYLDDDLKEIPRIVKNKTKIPMNSTTDTQYKFTSTVTLKYKKADSMQNLTCKGTKNYERFLSSILANTISNNRIEVKFVTGQSFNNDDEPLNNSAHGIAATRFGKNEHCSFKIHINLQEKKYNCTSTDNSKDIGTFLILCGNPDECYSFLRKENCSTGQTSIVKEGTPCKVGSDNCITFRPNSKPGVIVCSDGVSSLGMKYQLVWLKYTDSDQYYEKLDLLDENIKGNVLMNVTKMDEFKYVYDGMEHTFECRVSMYRFVHGIEWRLRVGHIGNDTLPNQKAILSIYPNDTEEYRNESEQFYTSTVKLVFNKTYGENQTLFCEAPLWNEEKLTGQKGIEIKILDSSPPSNPTLRKVHANDTYRCETLAQPPANISWFAVFDKKTKEPQLLDNTNYNGYNITYGENWSEVPEKYFSPLDEIEIRCQVKNFKGTQMVSVIKPVISTSSSPNPLNPLLILVGVGGILLLFLLVLFIIFKIRQQKLRALTDDDIDEFVNGVPDESNNNPILLPYNIDFEIPKEKLQLDDGILGSGNFGTVRKGRYDSKVVAIKTVKKSAEVMYFKSLFSELKILCYIGKHPNLVNLIGACTKNIRNREMFIVVEYCCNGNLLKLLRNCRPTFINHFETDTSSNMRESTVQYVNAIAKKISTRDLIKWSAEIANGMEFLSTKHVIHADLAARNILVSEDMTAKVCDFGLSKQLFEYSVYVQKPQSPLPLKWMAVESLRDLEFSLESDIWSFGITLWEVFTLGQAPYPGIDWNYTSWKLLKGGYRMEKPDYINDSMYQLMLKCWDIDAKRRIPFGHLKTAFERELRSVLPLDSTYL